MSDKFILMLIVNYKAQIGFVFIIMTRLEINGVL